MKRPAVKPGPPPARNDQPVKDQGGPQCQPLIRRPRTFALLLLLFMLWLAALLALYYKTVYPMRYPSNGSATTARS